MNFFKTLYGPVNDACWKSRGIGHFCSIGCCNMKNRRTHRPRAMTQKRPMTIPDRRIRKSKLFSRLWKCGNWKSTALKVRIPDSGWINAILLFSIPFLAVQKCCFSTANIKTIHIFILRTNTFIAIFRRKLDSSGYNNSQGKGINPPKRKKQAQSKKGGVAHVTGNSTNALPDGHMTAEEVERHLQSRQTLMELVPERAPATVPNEMFSNEPSLDR